MSTTTPLPLAGKSALVAGAPPLSRHYLDGH